MTGSNPAAVSVTHTKDYDFQRVYADMRAHFARLGADRQIKPGMRVLIKPNLVLKRAPEEATTTHPAVIEAIVRCVQDCGATDIIIADSPGGPFTESALRGIYEVSGMAGVAERTGAKLNYDTGSFVRERAENKLLHSFTLINPVQNADFIIDAVKVKTHGMTMLSGGVKNLFGTVPGLMKPEFHWRFPDKSQFCEMLVDLCETVHPSLVIADAVVSMEGDGPTGGAPKETGLLLSSLSPYSLDVVLCDMIGLSYADVSTVTHAMERGLCPKNGADIPIIGGTLTRFSDFKMPKSKSIAFAEKIPSVFQPLVNKMLTSKPAIRKKDCVGCGKCAESCPAKTIRVIDKKAQINYKNCIRCFCCHEMCPIKAIDIRRFKLFDW